MMECGISGRLLVSLQSKNMHWLLGLDLGTSSVKALAVREDGRVIGEASQPYGIERPQPNWAEQDPRVWWAQACAAIRNLLSEHALDPTDLVAIGLSGQMHGTVLLGADRQPIHNAIIWADGRSGAQVTALEEKLSRRSIVNITGNRPAVGFMALSLAWLREHEPELLGCTAHVLLPKDYIGSCLTGELASEPSDASATLLFDLRQRNWSQTLIDAVGAQLRWLPRIAQSNEIVGQLTAAAAVATGLSVGTPVIAGGGDTHCAALSLGAVNPQRVVITIGTAAQLFVPTDQPVIDPQGRLHSLCHCLPNTWHVMGAHLNGGLCLSWVASLWPETTIDALLTEAAQVPAGSDGLLFLPYLQGERTPHFDPDTRGVLLGLSTSHGRAQMVRAVLEGVAFALKDSWMLMHALPTGEHQIGQSGPLPSPHIYLTGGATRSAVWAQILVDVIDLPMQIAETQGSAYGAAMLAGWGSGLWTDPLRYAAQPQRMTMPSANVVRYLHAYERFRKVYPALRGLF